MKHGEMLEKIRSALQADDSLTAADLARRFEVSVNSIYAQLNKHGIAVKKGKKGRAPKPRVWTGHFGHTEKLSSHFIGGASEMIVCADLLKRGIPVYRAITFLSSADLIADMDGALVRIEVKSAKRNENGNFQFAAPHPERFDVLALVDQHGAVDYRPPIDGD